MIEATTTEDKIAFKDQRIRDLEAALYQKNLDIAVTFRLTPALADLFGVLLSLPLVTAETIQQHLAIATDRKVAIHRLRQVLRPWHERVGAGQTLIHGKRHLGYWIEPADKERILLLISAYQGARSGQLPSEVMTQEEPDLQEAA